MQKIQYLSLLTLPIMGLLAGMQLSIEGSPYLLMACLAVFYALLSRFKRSCKFSLLGAYLFGYAFFAYSHSWISTPLAAFGDMYSHLQPIAYVAVPAILALYFLIVGLVNAMIRLDGFRRVLSFTVTLVSIEFLRCEFAPAVPLGQLGTVWLFHPYMAQGASLFGVYGLSLVTVFMGVALGQVQWKDSVSKIPDFLDIIMSYLADLPAKVAGSSRCIDPDTEHVDTFPGLRYTRSFWVGALIFALLSIWGIVRMATTPLIKRDAQVRLVPTDWRPQDKYRSLESRVKHLQELVSASVTNLSNGVSLIVWPETTIEFQLQKTDGEYDFSYRGVREYLQQNILPHATLLAGGVLREQDSVAAYNVVFAIDQASGLSYVYKKRYLAPFGEFMPEFLKPITQALKIRALDDFARGEACQSMLSLQDNTQVKPVICYEGSFSRRILNMNERPDLFAVGTNDIWFNEIGKEQQFISHVFRAIEEGVPMVRVANSGLSGYISPLGSCFFSRKSDVQDITTHHGVGPTFLRKLTDVFLYWVELFLAGMVLILLALELCYRKKVAKNSKVC